MKFKIGDRVKVNTNWEDYHIHDDITKEVLVIESINENYKYKRRIVTKIEFDNKSLWAEPHEISHLTPLDELL